MNFTWSLLFLLLAFRVAAMEKYKYEVEVLLDASCSQVYRAWTDEAVLEKWLGDVFLTNDKQLVLSSDMPYHSGSHRVRECDKGKSLTYDWYVDGVPTALFVSFEAHEKKHEKSEKTKLHIKHNYVPSKEKLNHYIFSNPKRKFGLIGGSWEVAMYRLKHALNETHGVKIPKHQNDQTIILSIECTASIGKVWDILTNATTMQQMAPDFHLKGTKVEPVVGGVYSYGWYPADTAEKDMYDGPSKVLEIEPKKRLKVNWHGATPSTVTWELSEIKGGGTKISFTHAQMPAYPPEEIWSYRLGWAMHLEGIKLFLESGIKHEEWYKLRN